MEIFGKHRPKKKKWITDDILEMCDKRRVLKNKKHDAQRRRQYREINNKIRKAIKQAKENWIEEQCEEIDTNLTENNTKRAYQIVKYLTTTKEGKASTIKDKFGKKVSLKIKRSSLVGQNIVVIRTTMKHRVTVQY